MLNTQSVKHDYKRFFLFTDDYLDIAKIFCRRKEYSERQAYSFVVNLRVLETWKNDLLSKLDKDGVTEEELTEEMFWMDVEWSSVCERALHIFESRTFQKTLPRLIEAGFARQRYIKRLATGDRVCGNDGMPLVYETYKEAQRDKRHPGEIVHQVFFCSDAVNEAIAQLSPTPPPDQRGGDETQKSGDNAREKGGNPVTMSPPVARGSTARGGNPVTESSSKKSISSRSYFCERERAPGSQISYSVAHNAPPPSQENEASASGTRKQAKQGSQKSDRSELNASQTREDPARKHASNKNLITKNPEESLFNKTNSAARAIAHAVDPLILSQFDFSQSATPDAILQLSRILYAPLPVCYRSEEDKERAYTRINSAAQAIAAMSLVHELGLRRLAALMAYQADEASPCTWRSYCRKMFNNPRFVPRLWNLESELVLYKMSQEMDASGWWPDYLPLPGLVEKLPEIDLAELAGVEPSLRQGMDVTTASEVRLWLEDQLTPHGYTVSWRVVGPRGATRGFAIEVGYIHDDGTQRILRFYRFEEWELIIKADEVAPIGSLEFIRYLAEALRWGQVA